jgi:hypothetical protein
MSSIKNIERKINKLSPKLIDKLDAYVDFLLSKNPKKTPERMLKQTWAGGLKEYNEKYNSIELQKKALEWRIK